MVLDTSRRVGKSKMRVMRTGIGYLALFRARSRWRALAAIDERHGPADVPVLEEIDEIDEQHRPAAVNVLDEIDERRQPAAVHAPLRGD